MFLYLSCYSSIVTTRILSIVIKIIPNVVSLWVADFVHRAYLVKSIGGWGELWPIRKFIDFPDDDTNDGAKSLKCMS